MGFCVYLLKRIVKSVLFSPEFRQKTVQNAERILNG